jgi:methylglutaconyl-CoA hydratase
MSADGLDLQREGPTLTALVARGPGNRFTTEMSEALAEAVVDAARDPSLRFVRLRAAGDVFCLGREREGSSPDEVRAVSRRIVGLNEVLRDAPLVVICEVNGDAAGFGVGLVAASDVAITVETARFWFPEMEAGFAPAVVLSWLGGLLPHKRAFELAATGRRMSAAEALACGLVTELAAPGEAAAAAERWIERLSELDAEALRDVKEFLGRVESMDRRAAGRSAADLLTLGSLRLERSG